jgi:hypothetical protein
MAASLAAFFMPAQLLTSQAFSCELIYPQEFARHRTAAPHTSATMHL